MELMNKLVVVSLLTLWVATGVDAQNIYEAAKFTSRDLNGTARFVVSSRNS